MIPRFGLRLGALGLALAMLGCSGEDDALVVHSTHQAIGVPQDGFPNWEERVILVLTNRARSDPDAENQAVCGGACASYPASKPLAYTYDRGRAARFQATSLLKSGSGLMHDSVCTLVSNLGDIYPSSCDGDPSCACEGGSASCTCSGTKPFCSAPGGLTLWSSRVKLFGTSAAGENAAAGNSDPIKTFAQWVKSSGHWSNINKATHGTLGTGHFGGSGGCWKDFWVQVFGGGSSVEKLLGGAHYPRTPGTTTPVKFWANYHDAGAPQLATVNINGTCYKMSLERGVDASGTYLVEQPIASTGCHHYYFYFRDSTGAVATYPSTGSFGVGVGTSSCADYSAATRPTPGAGCGGCSVDADCDDSNPCTGDTCVANKCQNTAISGCCTADVQCDDADPCTQNSCVGNSCQSSPISGCCKADADCADNNPCTDDKCVGNKCQNTTISGCCTAAAQCDDSDPCTQNSCVDNSCQFAPIGGCCKADADCDDSSDCTADSCVGNKCQFSPISGCCTADADCADNNPCTTETCQLPAGNCSISLVEACCQTDADCDDADPCTIDSCDTTGNSCAHSIAPGCAVPDAGVNEAGSTPGSDGGVADLPPQRGLPGSGTTLAGGCSVGGEARGAGPLPLLLLVLLGLCRRRR